MHELHMIATSGISPLMEVAPKDTYTLVKPSKC
jgi:DNA helicase II / ATP-dependent DNA helicase PcrA